jgi:hypothetical protein
MLPELVIMRGQNSIKKALQKAGHIFSITLEKLHWLDQRQQDVFLWMQGVH